MTSSDGSQSNEKVSAVSQLKKLVVPTEQRPPGLCSPITIDLTPGLRRHRKVSETQKNDRLQAQLRALQADYATRLTVLLEEMGARWQQLIEQDWRPEELLELRRQMHKLAGSAASFGFTRIGHLAGQIEAQLWEWEDRPQAPIEREQHAVSELLQTLRTTATEKAPTAIRPY